MPGHVQEQRATWPLMLVALGLLGAAGAALAAAGGGDAAAASILVAVCLLLAGVGLAFRRMRVEVGAREVRVAFALRWLHRSVPLAEVDAVAPVRSAWWHGWGIHLVAPRTWLWNVAGRDAVELVLADGRRWRIGSDDPAELAAAIEAARGDGAPVGRA